MALCLLSICQVFAAYTSIPWSVSNNQFTVDGYTFKNSTGYYTETSHFVIFWSTGYGYNSSGSGTMGSGTYQVNLTNMKTMAENCYSKYVSTLGFTAPNNKIIILLYYTTDWIATGSGESGYGTLNVGPTACVDGSYYTFCHEIAHAFQYVCYARNGGNAGFAYESGYYGYVSYYECSANWQAGQIYPSLAFPQSAWLYNRTTNLNYLHEWHCYQSYWMNYYWTEKRSADAVGKIWSKNTGNVAYVDPAEKYMAVYGIDATRLYKEFFWAAMRFATWDLSSADAALSAEGASRDTYINHTPGTSVSGTTYQYVTTNSSKAIHQVAYSSCPQSTGYNVIKLNVPTSSSNRTVTTTFTALAPGASLASGDKKQFWNGASWSTGSFSTYNTDYTSECNSNYSTYKSWRGFRLGYVTYKKSTGERKYCYTDKVYCTGTSESSVSVQIDVPTDVDSLYLVVSPALTQYLRRGSNNPYEISESSYATYAKKADQWPYRVQFYNTNIYGLSNPSTTFSGSADKGTFYTSSGLESGTADSSSSSSSSSSSTASATTWDFSSFSSKVVLAGSNYTYSYNGLTLVGNTKSSYTSDYVSKSGFHCNGASSSSMRYIKYTPSYNGTLTVYFKSNNSSDKNRTTAIGKSVGSAISSATCSTGQVSVSVSAGTTYYAYFVSGGQTITKIVFTPTSSAKAASFDDEATGIETVDQNAERNVPVYDLSGRRYNSSDNLPKGIYIRGGKKFLVR